MTKATEGLRGPPAVWTAFAQQGRWKNWVMVGQLVTVLFLSAVCMTIAQKPPDIVVVAEDGQGTYVDSASSSKALQSFLREQRGKASDVTLRAFSERFVRLTAGINSTTFDEAWAEALSLMVAPLAAKMSEEATSQKLLETYRLAQVRSTLDFDALDVVERRGEKTHVRVKVRRRKEKLMGGAPSEDVLLVDLALMDVPRSRQHPDGLEVLEWRSSTVAPSDSPSAEPKVSP